MRPPSRGSYQLQMEMNGGFDSKLTEPVISSRDEEDDLRRLILHRCVASCGQSGETRPCRSILLFYRTAVDPRC